MTQTCKFVSKQLGDTDRLGAALARHLPAQSTIALIGTLGTGKTQLVRSLCAACQVDPEIVVSPTFVLLQQYHGHRMIHHLDAYRIKDDDEFLQLGVEELYEMNGIVAIEWADRVANCLPSDYLEIRIEDTGMSERTFTISSRGARYDAVITGVEQELRP